MQALMKQVLTAISVIAVVPAMAQMNHTMPGGMVMSGKSMEPPAAKATVDAALGEGMVKKVDKAKGTVTLQHGALPNGMPPMTMAYKVKDAALLDKLQVGKKIRFATDPADGGMTVTQVEAVK